MSHLQTLGINNCLRVLFRKENVLVEFYSWKLTLMLYCCNAETLSGEYLKLRSSNDLLYRLFMNQNTL